MMNFLARDIASRLHRRSSYISESHIDLALADLREIARFDLSALKQSFEERKTEILANYGFNQPSPPEKPFAFAEGTAIIPIQGMLVNRLSWASSFATGYNFIRSQLGAALSDSDVVRILFDVNSYGGLAAGCDEVAADIFAARGQKPMLAVVDANAYSAAYYVASAADRIVATPTGGVGSIGVAVMHVDYTKALKTDGIKVTIFRKGVRKIERNPFEKLTEQAKTGIQTDIDYYYGLFTDAVARHRDMRVEDVQATQSATFLPPEAKANGLIDDVQTPAEAIAGFLGGSGMTTTQNNGGGASAAAVPAPAATATPATPAAMSAAETERMVAGAVASALSAERKRASAIRTCEEAKGREGLAAHLAESTEMSVDQARAVLAAAEKAPEQAQPGSSAGGNPLQTAMERTTNPNIRPDGSGDGTGPGAEDTPQARADRLIGAYGRATGARFENGKVIDLTPTHVRAA